MIRCSHKWKLVPHTFFKLSRSQHVQMDEQTEGQRVFSIPPFRAVMGTKTGIRLKTSSITEHSTAARVFCRLTALRSDVLTAGRRQRRGNLQPEQESSDTRIKLRRTLRLHPLTPAHIHLRHLRLKVSKLSTVSHVASL